MRRLVDRIAAARMLAEDRIVAAEGDRMLVRLRLITDGGGASPLYFFD